MFNFRRKKQGNSQTVKATSSTFEKATGGGWADAPEKILVTGGTHDEFVEATLKSAYAYAIEKDVSVGEVFDFTIIHIPSGIGSPHEIIFGLLMRAGNYGLSSIGVMNETASFKRLR